MGLPSVHVNECPNGGSTVTPNTLQITNKEYNIWWEFKMLYDILSLKNYV